MQVGINARLLASSDLRGWNRYTVNLLAELAEQGACVTVYSDAPLHESHRQRLSDVRVSVSPRMRYPFWEQFWLPRQCAVDGIDILHCPVHFGLPWRSGCAQVLTLHDAIGWNSDAPARLTPLRIKSWWPRLDHWITRRSADRIITVSQYSRQELVKYLRVPENQIVVVYEAADERFHQPITNIQRERVRRAHGLARPFVFYIGGWEERKNIPFLVQSFAQARLDGVELVLAGGRPEQFDELTRLAAALNVQNRVRLLGLVADDDLPALYAEALCFVYPSRCEGFGLQLCEAMATGCPTLASCQTSLPEVLGDGGETFPLDDTAPLAGLLGQIASDPGFRSQLIDRAQIRGRQFSWAETARQTLDVYRSTVQVLKPDVRSLRQSFPMSPSRSEI